MYGNGLPATPTRTVARIKNLMVNKKKSFVRSVAARLKLGFATVSRVLKKNNNKVCNKRKVQGMKPDHKVNRALREYVRGKGPGSVFV